MPQKGEGLGAQDVNSKEGREESRGRKNPRTRLFTSAMAFGKRRLSHEKVGSRLGLEPSQAQAAAAAPIRLGYSSRMRVRARERGGVAALAPLCSRALVPAAIPRL